MLLRWRREGSSKCYSLLEKHTTVVVTTVSASAQSCFRRAQKGAMSSRGAAAVVRIRLSGQKPAFRVGVCTLVFLRHLPWSGKGGKGDLALRDVCGDPPLRPCLSSYKYRLAKLMVAVLGPDKMQNLIFWGSPGRASNGQHRSKKLQARETGTLSLQSCGSRISSGNILQPAPSLNSKQS